MGDSACISSHVTLSYRESWDKIESSHMFTLSRPPHLPMDRPFHENEGFSGSGMPAEQLSGGELVEVLSHHHHGLCAPLEYTE